MDFAYHPSLKKTLKECQEWLAYPGNPERPVEYSADLQTWLDAPERPARMQGNPVADLAHYYGVAACAAYGRKDAQDLVRFLHWTVALRAIHVRMNGMFSERHPDLGNWPWEFWDSMEAASPLMMSAWHVGRTCAERFIEMAEKDERVNRPPATRMVNHGTNDVFLIGLFSQAFDIATAFQPREPLIESYRRLLDVWRTEDESDFQAAMGDASEFHISRSKSGSRYKFCEFEKIFDRVFPVELLAVQALRRRDGLPAFEAGHLLVDGPWAVIKDLPDAEPHPLIVQVEAQLHRDYPDFR